MIEHTQDTQYSSPWTIRQRVKMLIWEYVWLLFCKWTPKPANPWRIYLLRLFGCKISGRPFVHQRAKILIPWNLTLHDRSCLGDGANAYSLGEIEVFSHATVAQEAYLCTGTHRFDHPSMALRTGKITIGSHAFVGARAFVMPGIDIAENALIGACSVVTKNVGQNMVVAGNPAQVIGTRDQCKISDSMWPK